MTTSAHPPVHEDLPARVAQYFATVSDDQLKQDLRDCGFDFYNRIGRAIGVPDRVAEAAGEILALPSSCQTKREISAIIHKSLSGERALSAEPPKDTFEQVKQDVATAHRVVERAHARRASTRITE